MTRKFTLTLSCPNRSGIVHAVSSYLVGQGCDIAEYRQFDDGVKGRLFPVSYTHLTLPTNREV